MHGRTGVESFGDYWNAQELALYISTNEMLAMCCAFETLPSHVRDCRVNLQVDSQVAISSHVGQGSKSSIALCYLVIWSWNFPLFILTE